MKTKETSCAGFTLKDYERELSIGDKINLISGKSYIISKLKMPFVIADDGEHVEHNHVHFIKSFVRNSKLACRECNGKGVPKKTHRPVYVEHINSPNEIIDCLECQDCEHVWIPEYMNESFRGKAIKWFENKSSLDKTRLCDINTGILGATRRYETLTGREIEMLYLLHRLEDDAENSNSSNKIFSTFDRQLFAKYADKFSQEDKVRMLQWLATDLHVLSMIDESLRPKKGV